MVPDNQEYNFLTERISGREQFEQVFEFNEREIVKVELNPSRFYSDLEREAVAQGIDPAIVKKFNQSLRIYPNTDQFAADLVKIHDVDLPLVPEALKKFLEPFKKKIAQNSFSHSAALVTDLNGVPCLVFDLAGIVEAYTNPPLPKHVFDIPSALLVHPEASKTGFTQFLDAIWRHERQHLIQGLRNPGKSFSELIAAEHSEAASAHHVKDLYDLHPEQLGPVLRNLPNEAEAYQYNRGDKWTGNTPFRVNFETIN